MAFRLSKLARRSCTKADWRIGRMESTPHNGFRLSKPTRFQLSGACRSTASARRKFSNSYCRSGPRSPRLHGAFCSGCLMSSTTAARRDCEAAKIPADSQSLAYPSIKESPNTLQHSPMPSFQLRPGRELPHRLPFQRWSKLCALHRGTVQSFSRADRARPLRPGAQRTSTEVCCLFLTARTPIHLHWTSCRPHGITHSQ